MSKLSKLIDAIEKLDEAEAAILEARKAFDGKSESVTLRHKADAVYEIKWTITQMYQSVEGEIIEAKGIARPAPARRLAGRG